MRFMLFYAGVFALIALTVSVGVGLVATDRVVMSPGGRIAAQAVHRAASFAAAGFLAIHIAVEVIAGRSRPADAVVPFLDHGRTLYLGLGTVASDLVVLVVVTGLLRGRFANVRPAWAWRALHAIAYLCWPLAILHGLLAGRTAKPYVDWSYGACVAAVVLGLIVRIVAGRRVRETAGSPAAGSPYWAGEPGSSALGGPYQPGMGAPGMGAPGLGVPGMGGPGMGGTVVRRALPGPPGPAGQAGPEGPVLPPNPVQPGWPAQPTGPAQPGFRTGADQ
jgi:DMSO/TMAO reductase YedYZ heme-binding membrane subunit